MEGGKGPASYVKTMYFISRDIIQLRYSLQTIFRYRNEFPKFAAVLVHHGLVPLNQSIKKEEEKEQRPLTLNVLKNLQFCWFIMQAIGIL